MDISKEDVVQGLKIAATLATGMYAGGVAYSLYSSQPAAMSLDGGSAAKYMKQNLKNAGPLRTMISLGTVSSAAAYFLSRGTPKEDVAWIVGSCCYAALIPFTGFVIFPINNKFLHDEVGADDAKGLMERWLTYQKVRTAVGFGVFACFAYKLLKS